MNWDCTYFLGDNNSAQAQLPYLVEAFPGCK